MTANIETILDWRCTCTSCPTQYDIYDKGVKVAYLRMRHGNLAVHPYKHGDIDWHTTICAMTDKWEITDTDIKSIDKQINDFVHPSWWRRLWNRIDARIRQMKFWTNS